MVNKETQYITAYEEDSSSIYWAGRYLKLVELQKALFRVVGMYCSTCKPIVEKQLKGEQAIKNIDIDFMTDSVIVEYDSKLLTKEKIREKLEKSGYKFVRVATQVVLRKSFLPFALPLTAFAEICSLFLVRLMMETLACISQATANFLLLTQSS